MTTICLTGAAGFIGYHTARRLLARGDTVVGLDNLNDYYDVRLKTDRLAQLENEPRFRFQRLDLADRDAMARLFDAERFEVVVHLAAQAGVRYSLTNPHAYVQSNLVGFTNVLEGCRHSGVGHLLYASSSSVYGANTRLPFSVHDNVDHPLSLYAATKKANELMAHTYSHLYPPHDEVPGDAGAMVVLSGYVRPPGKMLPEAELGSDTLLRCLHAARLYKAKPCLVIVSGGQVDPSTPGPTLARVMHDFLLGQGVKEEDLLMEDRSRTTYENAVLSGDILSRRGIDKLVLVTSASHMPRGERGIG